MPNLFGDVTVVDIIVVSLTGLLLIVFVGGLFVACREAAQHMTGKWHLRWHRK